MHDQYYSHIYGLIFLFFHNLFNYYFYHVALYEEKIDVNIKKLMVSNLVKTRELIVLGNNHIYFNCSKRFRTLPRGVEFLIPNTEEWLEKSKEWEIELIVNFR